MQPNHRFKRTVPLRGTSLAALGAAQPGVRRSTVTLGASIASMFVGGMVYVLWRPDSLTMFSWFSTLGLDRPVGAMRAWAAAAPWAPPDWVCLSAPQALWLLSGCLAVHSIWGDARCPQERFWMAALTLLAVGAELGQAAQVVEGSFDPLDLALLALAFAAAQTIALSDSRRRIEEVCT